MYTQFEEKGKIFTNVISKIPINVVIQTTTHQIHAKYYVRPDGRIKDELNTPELFIAVTDALIFDNEGKQIYTSGFITINKSSIIWLVPQEELKGLGA